MVGPKGPKLRDRPEAWPRVRLPAPVEAEVEAPPLAGPGESLTQAPHVEALKDHTGVLSPATPSPGASNGKGAGEI
eukprot:3518238-Amphidinium_carterae.1